MIVVVGTKRVISLDQSLTHAGWIVWEDGLIYDYGVIKTTNQDPDHIRIMNIVEQLRNIIIENNVETLVLEGLSFGSISTSVRVLSGLYYSILIMNELEGNDFVEFSPTSVKKFATGSGKAKKPDMWKALPDNVKAKFEKTHKTIASGKYDLADGYFIGQMYLQNYNK